MEQIRIIKEMRTAEQERGRTGEHIRPRFMVWENVPGAFSSGTPKGEDFRIVLEEILRIHHGGASVPRCFPYSWLDAGAIEPESSFSLAWRCLDAQLCKASHNCSYVQNGIMKRKNQNPVFPVINS